MKNSSNNADSTISEKFQTKLLSLKSLNKSTKDDSPKTKLKKLFGGNNHPLAAPNSIANLKTFSEHSDTGVKNKSKNLSASSEMKLSFSSKSKFYKNAENKYFWLILDKKKEAKQSVKESYDDENNDLKLVVDELIADRYQIIDRYLFLFYKYLL